MKPLITVEGATKEYGDRAKVVALQPTDLTILPGEFVVLLGPSGSGKTTLLNLLGGLDRPTAGRVCVDGVELSGLSDGALGEFRRKHVGFVFQFFNLVPSLTARENVALAAEITGVDADAEAMLAAVGLGGIEDRFPAEMSGGQQQRVAIARALSTRPAVLLCDEPTGALDRSSGAEIVALLDQSRRAHGQTILVVTHDPTLAERAHRIVNLCDGRITSIHTPGRG